MIGKDGKLPWHLSSDLKTFRRLTLGKPVLMGRRTFQSIGKPLDRRDNIVVTRDPHFAPDGVSVTDNIADALTLARVLARTSGADEIMVIGGAKVYGALLDVADRIYLTRVHASPDGDRTFADPDPMIWQEVSREPLPQGPKDQYGATLIVLERREPASSA